MQVPAALLKSLQTVTGFDEEAFVQVHAREEWVTSVRRNPFKIFNKSSSIFNARLERVPWSSEGYYLPERPSFTLDPLFHAGAYYVQEASSMFLEEAIRQTVDLSLPLRALDACAAPGGKSTLLQSLISKESLLVANEVIKPRVNILTENITKWGAANVIVTNNDPRDFQRLPGYFDLIVVDAPCSGSGLFRRDPAAATEWSENNVQLCSQRQQRILADLLPALKEGGVLVYSTCSYSPEEDEELLDLLMDTGELENLVLNIQSFPGIVATGSIKHEASGYRFYPDKIKGEGFFIAVFRKTTATPASKPAPPKSKPGNIAAKAGALLATYLRHPDAFVFRPQQDQVLALPVAMESELLTLQGACYIRKAGISMGTLIRDELLPDHALAMSDEVLAEEQRFSLDLATARQYLRREDIRLDGAPKGWVLLCYEQLPLGWAKVLPNRINNYYPREWRILNK
ncbi:MAG: RNA methyltransferase [Ferruginibacter sp.]